MYGHLGGFNGWYSASDLELGGEWDEQWIAYIKGLAHDGIRIGNLGTPYSGYMIKNWGRSLLIKLTSLLLLNISLY